VVPHKCENLFVNTTFIFSFFTIRFFRGAKFSNKDLLSAVWAAMALGMLAKTFLHTRFDHYGFYLSLAASMQWIAFSVEILPGLALRFGGSPAFVRAGAAFATLGFCFLAYAFSQELYARKTFILGQGGDSMAVPGLDYSTKGLVLAKAAQWIEANVPENARLLSLPECSILNFLTKRRYPGIYTLNPVELAILGEEAISSPWREDPPEFVMIFTRDFREFGLDYFGRGAGYGKRTYDWILANYAPLSSFGASPLESDEFGIIFFGRKAGNAGDRKP
jgi:hypothetical protein